MFDVQGLGDLSEGIYPEPQEVDIGHRDEKLGLVQPRVLYTAGGYGHTMALLSWRGTSFLYGTGRPVASGGATA